MADESQDSEENFSQESQEIDQMSEDPNENDSREV